MQRHARPCASTYTVMARDAAHGPPHARRPQPAAAVRGRQPVRRRPRRCRRRWSARARAGRSTACATAARWPAPPRRRSTAGAPSATRRGCETHDRYGHRVDRVDYDPSWHWLLRGAVEREIHALPWRDPRPGAHVARAALELLWTQANAGVMCPVSMTYSAVPALRADPELAAEWEPRLTLPDYERGALCGMAMTEKQGGSDVRAGTTRAEPAGDGGYELTGHKWFCSHPMCDVFLVLAQAPGGLSCFVVERGPGFEIQRLKDKLGTRSLAVERGRVPRRAGAAARRGGPRRGDDHRDGHPHAAGLRDRQRGRHAPRRRRGRPPRAPPQRVRRAAGRAAADGQRARRPRGRVRGRDGGGAAARARLRRGRQAAAPLRHRGHEVLDLQAGDAARRRGARVPGRQRLRRGVADAAAAARRAAERDLGGLGQRDLARRAARARARARRPARVPGRVRARRAAPTARLDAHLDALPATLHELAGDGRPVARAPRRRGPRARVPGLAARPPRAAARWPTRSAPAGSARRAGACSARSRAASTAPRSSSARSPPGRPAADSLSPHDAARAARRRARRRRRRPGLRQPGGRARARCSSACPGFTRDGHDFAPDAVARGAAALVVARPLGLGVPEVRRGRRPRRDGARRGALPRRSDGGAAPSSGSPARAARRPRRTSSATCSRPRAGRAACSAA